MWLAHIKRGNDVDAFNQGNIKAARLTPTPDYSNGVAGVARILNYMIVNSARYYIDLQQGLILAATTDAAMGVYFYDSNGLGLSSYTSADGFKTDVLANITNEGWASATTPWIYSVADA
jgi:hypothetical protein